MTLKIDSVLRRTDTMNTIELNWLSKIRTPEEEMDEQPNLKYSDKDGFSLENNDIDNCMNPMWWEGISVQNKDHELDITRKAYLPLKHRRPKAVQSDNIKKYLKNPKLLDDNNPVPAEKEKKSTEVSGKNQKKK